MSLLTNCPENPGSQKKKPLLYLIVVGDRMSPVLRTVIHQTAGGHGNTTFYLPSGGDGTLILSRDMIFP